MKLLPRALLGLLLLIQAVPVPAQEIGAFAGGAWSDHRRAGDPTFLGIRVQYLVESRFGVRVEYTRYKSTPRWSGSTCDSYWPFYEGCRDETVENRMELRSYDFSIVAVPLIYRGWRVELAAGITQNDLDNEVRGVETGRSLYSDSGYDDSNFEDVLSFLGKGGDGSVHAATVSHRGIAQLPITLGASWRHRSLGTPVCGTDVYCLYGEDLHLHEVALHGSWSF